MVTGNQTNSSQVEDDAYKDYLDDQQSVFKSRLVFFLHISVVVRLELSVGGLVPNLFIILIINRNPKILKDQMYLCMSLNAKFNSLFCLIYILKVANECVSVSVMNCPAFFQGLLSQYVKIVVVTYLGNAVKVCANVTFILTSVSRYLLIGKDQAQFFHWLAKICQSRKKILSLVAVSLAMSSVKYFEFEVNVDFDDLAYPYLHGSASDLNQNATLKVIFFVFLLINDVTNYLLFSIVGLAMEVLIMLRLKQTLAEKMNQNSVSPNGGTATLTRLQRLKQKQNNRAEQRAFMTVIMSGLVNFVLRLPEILQPVYFVLTFFYAKSAAYNSMCTTEQICVFYFDITNWFYLLTLSLNFMVFYKYNVKFNECVCRSLFSLRKINN